MSDLRASRNDLVGPMIRQAIRHQFPTDVAEGLLSDLAAALNEADALRAEVKRLREAGMRDDDGPAPGDAARWAGALLLAISDYGDQPEGVTREAIESSYRMLFENLPAEHYGDCTGHAIACLLCTADTYQREGRELLRGLALLPSQPPPPCSSRRGPAL